MKPEDIGKADGAIEVKCSLLKGKVGEMLLKNRPKVSAWGEGRGGVLERCIFYNGGGGGG